MNPSSNEASGMQLPPPVVEQAPAGMPPETQPGGQPEQAPVGPAERAPRGPNTPAAVPAIPLPIPPTMSPTPTQTAVDATTQSAAAAAADDGDLIEKEWVNKAKAIVERTRDNPHQQSEELTGVKAEYLQRRYNKTLKLK